MSRISPATMSIGILAVLFGLGGAYAFRVYMRQQPQPVPPAPDRSTVPVASLDLPAGRIVSRGDIGLVSRDQMDNIPTHTMGNPLDIIGRVLRRPMKPGDAFQTTNLYPEGGGPQLSEQLKPGMRAVTVPIDSLGTIGGHVRPGEVVDVLFRATPKKDEDGFDEIPEMTVTLFEGVEVLAVGADPLANRPAADRDDEESTMISVTLACTPEQSGQLRAVLGHGEIALAMLPKEAPAVVFDEGTDEPLRNVKQVQDAKKTSGVTLEGILGIEPQPKQITTEIFRGGNRSVNVFDLRRKRAELVGSVAGNSPAATSKPGVPPAPATPASTATPAVAADHN